MKIYVKDPVKGTVFNFGDTKNGDPVPHIGERVFLGYAPSPTVTDVIYGHTDNENEKDKCILISCE